jgi:eukaryotic-like serine/threonine-protein kinase
MSDEVIGGYRLAKHMMTGQTSQVWEAVENSSGRHFALKLLLPEKVVLREHRRFMMHEAKVGKELTHPNIIRIVHIGQTPKNPYFVMEFFPAGNLKMRMQRAVKEAKEKDWLIERSPDILRQWATALAFMNAKGWVHRDVKPENLLVNSAGEVRLIDFALAIRPPKGLARWFARRARPAGTRTYMSPEQIRGEVVDGRSDIYSFGASTYELVTGRPPFRGATSNELLNKHIFEKPVNPQYLNADVTKEFADFLVQLLAKKREERPKDFHQVLMAMRSLKIYKSVESKSAKP